MKWTEYVSFCLCKCTVQRLCPIKVLPLCTPAASHLKCTHLTAEAVCPLSFLFLELAQWSTYTSKSRSHKDWFKQTHTTQIGTYSCMFFPGRNLVEWTHKKRATQMKRKSESDTKQCKCDKALQRCCHVWFGFTGGWMRRWTVLSMTWMPVATSKQAAPRERWNH